MFRGSSLKLNFYPRPPRGGRLSQREMAILIGKFLSTPSARRATGHGSGTQERQPISIHALREEGDFVFVHVGQMVNISIHALREEGDREEAAGSRSAAKFLSTPSARRATVAAPAAAEGKQISIHALREEGDGSQRQRRGCRNTISIHALREEGDRLGRAGAQDSPAISIHALREEGDLLHLPKGQRLPGISIHALREEGDLVIRRLLSTVSNFYPRPPRGGRQQRMAGCPHRSRISIHALREEGDGSEIVFTTDNDISIHALREEGDANGAGVGLWATLFLSTPSARRATAKTERKHPAFVSLYTSLHKLQRDACKPNRKITPLLAQTAGIPVRSVPENHVCCRFALAGHQKISTLSWANFGCSPTCSTLVW